MSRIVVQVCMHTHLHFEYSNQQSRLVFVSCGSSDRGRIRGLVQVEETL